ncbi:unnamed protein product, partial [Durusdinium trenchii]
IKLKAPKATNVSLQSNFVDNLRHFRSQNKLKKAALHIIAGQLNEDQIKQLRDVFMMIDGNGDGFLTVNELKEGLAKAGLKDIPPDLLQIMQEVDSDGSGNIDYTEFLAATLDKRTATATSRRNDERSGGRPWIWGEATLPETMEWCLLYLIVVVLWCMVLLGKSCNPNAVLE